MKRKLGWIPMRVLVVEDSTIVAARLLDLLREVPGLEIVGPARGVEETVGLVARVNPEVIILDLQIVGGTGLEVLRAVRAGVRHVAVIVLTNSASEPFRQACLEAGAEYFLDKSNEFDRLPGILALIGKESVSACRSSPEADPTPAEARSQSTPSASPGRRTGAR